MNPPQNPESLPWTPDRTARWAWLPIPLLLAAIIAARLAGLRDSYESPALLLVLSLTFYTLASLATLYLIGRSFLASGLPGLLLLECGVVFWSLAGTVGDFVSHGDANINVTIFNVGILLSGLCHLAGAILAPGPRRVLRAKYLWLGAGFAFALGALWLVSRAALMGHLPVFFIPGQGGTLVRYCVLISAIAMFVIAAGILHATQREARLPFASWYALALLLMAVGLFGIMIQLSLGSVVNWLSRVAQWLGGVYLLFAAIASLRESRLPLLPLQRPSSPAYYRDAVAVALVLATAAIRLTFLSALQTTAPFVTFFPAVAFASMYGGLRTGLLATALSAILVDYFWIEPVGFATGDPSDWLAIAIFLLSGAMIAGVSEAMHRARAASAAAEKQALLAAERAAAAEALQESRAKLEAALASMTDAVFISDVQGRFINFNDAFVTFHRFGNKDECARTFAEYPGIHDVFMANGDPAPPDQWAVPRALRGETATNAEYTLRRKDTGETWAGNFSFGPIRDKDGAIVGSVVTASDITERKKTELNLAEKTQQLEAAFKELEGFSYSVSHDLRAPLRHMSGFTEMLQKRIKDHPDEKIRHYAEVISASSKKMGILIDDLLAFSRIGRSEIRMKTVDMNGLVRETIRELADELKERKIEWNIGNLPDVCGDSALLGLALANLIANAVKFTRTCPRAVVEIACLTGTDGEYTFFVKDNGVGFDMKYEEKLFGVFQRLHHDDEFEGTGIGLANVRRIISRHGGRTWAEGVLGHGATFYFTLPITEETRSCRD